MDAELVSVIVPIYNVEKYIEKCIVSIINQTYKNIEIILVDDGSPDNCLEICEFWKNKDNRIKIIRKENGGLSDARNYGLEYSKGSYIVFVDSDDYVEKNFIEIMYNEIKNNDADLAICNYYLNYIDKQIQNTYYNNKFAISSNDKYNYLYNGYNKVTIVAWNKMYKRDIFKNIRYPKGKLHEDEFIICDILKATNKIVYILNPPLYHYIQRDDSIMAKFNVKRFDIIEALDKRISFFEEINDKRNLEITKYNQFFRLLGLLTRLYANDKKKFNEICKEKKYLIKLVMLGKDIKKYKLKLQEIIRVYLVLINPMLYIKLVYAIRRK